jgi:hypothetical protein
MKQLTIDDAEFGTIAVRCNSRAKRVVLRVLPSGEVRITIPAQRHLGAAVRLVEDARRRIREQRQTLGADQPRYQPGAMVGRRHQLTFRAANVRDITTRVDNDQIIIRYPLELDWDNPALQAKIHVAAKKALHAQSEEILAPRLAELAAHWGFTYKKLRLSSGHTRWGSCSSDGTISLNIGLVELSDQLTDYVICHELCHTVQHNHSERFWALVAQHTPQWRKLRKELKAQHPF